MDYKVFLHNYKISYYNLLKNKIYFPFHKIDLLLEDEKINKIKDTQELSQFLLESFINIFNNDYYNLINKPLVLVGTKEYNNKFKSFFTRLTNQKIDNTPRVSFKDKRLQLFIEKIEKMYLMNLDWRNFSIEFESLVKDILKVEHEENIKNLQYSPVILFALRYLIDDEIPDNYTAVWPIELWLHRLPQKYHSNFKDFYYKVYNNKEDIINILRKETPTDKMPHYLEKFMNKL